ncbi:glycosyltransferase family 4 protein [Patescibacteria group bacterium]|nr:glycosyltransferase family 4 protein [Patescibacteria group bacterium]MBU1501121.1 glycosyltransferase family 4 protein [Patescibacteria group bacterium]MBU2081006.1 glycosyltransferase family 4 protein [Patescibacteria group bacterium]MBU2124098.1 glycosyltransferase family 4 protein [Patescibacteria group bacterium]MBU2194953.1 glycosyltransferase family 4 protein [Patescibacteria group bacterium]
MESREKNQNLKPKVLFLYLGASRRKLLGKVQDKTEPDSQFRGYLQMKEREDMSVEFLDMYEEVNLPVWLIRILPFQLIPLLHLPKVLSFDYLIASDALFLATAVDVANKFRLRTTKWIFVGINIDVMLRRHAHNPFRKWLLTRTWKKVWRIAYLERNQKQTLLSVGIPEERMTYMPLGIDTDFFTKDKRLTEGEFVLSVGRDLGRDFETLFSAAALVPYRFVVATAPKNLPEGIEIPPNVEILFDIDITEINSLYERARMVCLVLKGEETTEGSDCTGQTVILEALAAGQAVIASDRRWLRSYFEPGKDYVPVPIGSVEALADSITELWNNEAKRRSLGQAGIAKVRSLYRTEGMAAVLVNLIKRDQY